MKINDDLLPIIVSPTEPVGSYRKKIWIQHSNNIFDASAFTNAGGLSLNSDYTITSTGISSYVWNYTNSQYKASFKGGQSHRVTIYFSSRDTSSYARMEIFDDSSTLIRSVSLQNVDMATTDFYFSADKQLGIMIKMDDGIAKIMISEGSAMLPYEAPIEDKEYILNRNNGYKKFEPQNERYSESEIKIGTWLDKKPLYRKMISTNNVLVNKNFKISLGTQNADRIVRAYFIYMNTGSHAYSSGTVWYDNDGILFMFGKIDNGDIRFDFAGSGSMGAVSNRYWYFVAEYTKTTD